MPCASIGASGWSRQKVRISDLLNRRSGVPSQTGGDYMSPSGKNRSNDNDVMAQMLARLAALEKGAVSPPGGTDKGGKVKRKWVGPGEAGYFEPMAGGNPKNTRMCGRLQCKKADICYMNHAKKA